MAYINDQMIELSARELSLLEVLLQRAGRLVSKDQLVERLCEWGEEVSNNAIEVYIHRLRKKIEQGPVRIATVRGLGYCLEKIAVTALPRRASDRMAPPARKQRSLFGEILDWMLAPLLLLWPMSVVLTWLVAQGIANQPSTASSATWRARWRAQVTVQIGAGTRRPGAAFALPPSAAGAAAQRRRRTRISYQVLGRAANCWPATRGCRCPTRGPRGRAGEVRFRDDVVQATPVRVAYLWVDGRGRGAGSTAPLVQVAETLGKRSRLATEIIKGVILPQFVILPLAVLLVWLALARGICAAERTAAAHPPARQHTTCSPIDERDAPEEVAPLVRAINDLLARLDRSIARAEAFPGRRRAPAEDAAGRAAHAGRDWRSARSTAAVATPRRSSARCSRSRARASAPRTWSTSCWRWRAPRTASRPRAHASRSTWPRWPRVGARLRAARDGEAHRPRLRRTRAAGAGVDAHGRASRCCCAS